MDTNVRLGVDCKLYISGGTGSFPAAVGSIMGVGTGSAPAFVELDDVQSVTVNLTKGESDVSIRGAGGIKLTRGALKEISFDLTIPYVRGDTKREALVGAWVTGDIVGIAALDGPINSANSKGFAVDCEVMTANEPQNIDGAVIQSLTLKPCFPGTDTNGIFTGALQVAGSAGGTLTIAATL